MLAPEDRDEFTHLHLGDRTLARFVCVLDYLIIQKVSAPDTALYQLAYSIAANIPMESPNLRVRAARAWKHDAVQALIERVRYRSLRQRSVKIENAQLLMIERVQKVMMERLDGETVSEETIKSAVAVMGNVTKYLAAVNQEDVKIRSERTRRGLDNARKAHNEREDLTKRELVALMKAHEDMLPANVKAALAELR